MAKVALYRKYRSTTFDDLYGQDHIVTILKNAVSKGKFTHAYLFYGPRGTGKTSAARILAKAINCEHNVQGNPDNKCDKCKLIDAGRSVDIIEIDAASHTQVENIREVIIEKAKFAPSELKYKVYIIDEAHMLSKSSFNALLKTLEEPPAHSVFILATTEINKIIPTIKSRCQMFDFHRIPEKAMKDRLRFIAKSEKIDIEEAALDLIVRVSEGGFRDAISILDQVSDTAEGKIGPANIEGLLGIADISLVEDFVFAVVEGKTKEALSLIERALAEGYVISEFYRNTIEVMRKLANAIVTGIEGLAVSEKTAKIYREVIASTELAKVVSILDTFVETEAKYRYSSIPQLVLEVATIKSTQDLPKPQKEPVVKLVSGTAPQPVTKPKSKNADAKWQEFLMEVKNKNNSIHAVLKVCEADFNGNEVCLTFPYKFHKERIEDARNRQVVEDVLMSVYGETYRIKCVLNPGMSTQVITKSAVKDDLLDDALDVFGGEVID